MHQTVSMIVVQAIEPAMSASLSSERRPAPSREMEGLACLLIPRLPRASPPGTDKEALPKVQARLAARELLPEQHLVDAGYVTTRHIAESQQKHGTTLMGPIMAEPSWQAKEGRGFAAADFKIDWEHKRAVCPQGKVSGNWQEWRADYGMETISIHFLKKVVTPATLTSNRLRRVKS